VLANWITLVRFPLLPATIVMLSAGSPAVRVAGALLLFLGLLLDTLDGVVARRRKETTLFGSVLDIAADRAYELVLWMWLAWLGLIPFLIPLAVILRTTVTDAFRSLEVGKGVAPFQQHRTALGRFLVGSTWMRTGYSISKTTVFAGFALEQALGAFPAGSVAWINAMALRAVLPGVAWVALGFGLLRGAPVVGHTLRHHWPGAAGREGGRAEGLTPGEAAALGAAQGRAPRDGASPTRFLGLGGHSASAR
jgi:phosphatidylglycerophosphate synthase